MRGGLFFACAALAAFSAGAARTGVTVVGSGWDLLDATTEDVWRNREKFAATGLDGILLSVDRVSADGVRTNGRRLLAPEEWKEDEFRISRAQIAECVRCAGLRESMALAFLIPPKRLAWTDDEAWRIAANNAGVLARVAKASGLKGLTLDHEDYSKQRQFRHKPSDPPLAETRRLARERGRQFFGALVRGFPDAKLLFYWMFTEWRDVVRAQDVAAAGETFKGGDLWPAFLNGLLDVAPDTVKYIDGNETTGYKTDVRKAAYREGAYETLRDVLPLVAPENRDAYVRRVSVGFGIYLDSYTFPEDNWWAFPALGGSRAASFRQNAIAASEVADDVIWVYGERGAWVDWDRKHTPKLNRPTWESQLPGLARAIRLASGRLSAARKMAAEGAMTNLVTDVESTDGKLPKAFSTYTDEKPVPADMFAWDMAEGASRPGCLKLIGKGSFLAYVTGLRPGEIIYVRLKAKARAPKATLGWRKGEKWDWSLSKPIGSLLLTAAQGSDPSSWRTFEGVFVVPDGVDGAGVGMSNEIPSGEPVFFDDVEVFR